MLIAAGLFGRILVPGATGGSLFSSLLNYPVKYPAQTISLLLNNNAKFWKGITNSGAIATKNEDLTRELAFAKMDLAKTKAIEDQLNDFRKLKNLAAPMKGKQVWGSVIGFDPYLHRMIINIGQDQGVTPNRAVICSSGLLGIVRIVEKKSSVVELLSSPNLRIGAMLMDGKYTAGIIRGQGGDTMKLGMLERNVSVPEGTQVVTSVHSELLPAWVPIGRVLSQKSTPEFGTQDINVKTSVNFGRVKDVAVIE